jgi:hypothetical protein
LLRFFSYLIFDAVQKMSNEDQTQKSETEIVPGTPIVNGDPVYEDRLLLFADVLGWSEEIKRGSGDALLKVVQRIHLEAEAHSERGRDELKQMAKKLGGRVNPMALEVQFGAFSDHFVFSMPAGFGSRICSAGSKLVIELLHQGFLTRGAIVVGKLHHKDNVVFGPALLQVN